MSWMLFNDAYLQFAWDEACASVMFDADADDWDAMLHMGCEL